MSESLCKLVSEYLPILMDPPIPNDPEEETLAPLRSHFASCPVCQAEADRRANVVSLIQTAFEFRDLELQIEAGAARRRSQFLEMIHAGQTAKSNSEPNPAPNIGAVEGFSTHVSRFASLVRFLEFRLAPQARMAAADRDVTVSRAQEQFFRLQHPEHPVLAEVVANPDGLEVFLSTSESALAEAVAEAELREHTGRSWNSVLQFSGGVAQWTVPVDAPFGGTYELALRIELPEDSKG